MCLFVCYYYYLSFLCFCLSGQQTRLRFQSRIGYYRQLSLQENPRALGCLQICSNLLIGHFFLKFWSGTSVLFSP